MTFEVAARVLGAAHAYEVLGVALGADVPTIKVAHRALVWALHPDFNPGDAVAAEACARANTAFDTLSDAAARARLDLLLKLPLCTACAGKGYTWAQRGFKMRSRAVCAACGGAGIKTPQSSKISAPPSGRGRSH